MGTVCAPSCDASASCITNAATTLASCRCFEGFEGSGVAGDCFSAASRSTELYITVVVGALFATVALMLLRRYVNFNIWVVREHEEGIAAEQKEDEYYSEIADAALSRARKLLARMDVADSGSVDFDGFCAWLYSADPFVPQLRLYLNHEMQQDRSGGYLALDEPGELSDLEMFDMLDVDGNGYLNMKEISNVVHSAMEAGVVPSPARAKRPGSAPRPSSAGAHPSVALHRPGSGAPMESSGIRYQFDQEDDEEQVELVDPRARPAPRRPPARRPPAYRQALTKLLATPLREHGEDYVGRQQRVKEGRILGDFATALSSLQKELDRKEGRLPPERRAPPIHAVQLPSTFASGGLVLQPDGDLGYYGGLGKQKDDTVQRMARMGVQALDLESFTEWLESEDPLAPKLRTEVESEARRSGQMGKRQTTLSAKEIFTLVDEDGSGKISLFELQNIARGTSPPVMAPELPGQIPGEISAKRLNRTTQDMFGALDEDGSGTVDYDEFCTWARKEQNLVSKIRASVEGKQKAELRHQALTARSRGDIDDHDKLMAQSNAVQSASFRTIFDSMDADGSGTVEMAEVRAVIEASVKMATPLRPNSGKSRKAPGGGAWMGAASGTTLSSSLPSSVASASAARSSKKAAAAQEPPRPKPKPAAAKPKDKWALQAEVEAEAEVAEQEKAALLIQSRTRGRKTRRDLATDVSDAAKEASEQELKASRAAAAAAMAKSLADTKAVEANAKAAEEAEAAAAAALAAAVDPEEEAAAMKMQAIARGRRARIDTAREKRILTAAATRIQSNYRRKLLFKVLDDDEKEYDADNLDGEIGVVFSKQQRKANSGEPACIICGRYGEFYVESTDHDVCSRQCEKKDK